MGCGSSAAAAVQREVPTCKIVLLGEPRSGKTSVFLRYARNQFDHDYQATSAGEVGVGL